MQETTVPRVKETIEDRSAEADRNASDRKTQWRWHLVYERLRPLIIWLGLTELAWMASWLLAAPHVATPFAATVITWVAAMLVWMLLVSFLGTSGFHLRRTRWFPNLIGVSAVVATTAAWFTATATARQGLVTAALATSDVQLAAFHILRLTAIGTMIKYWQRQLPLHFFVLGSIPDLLFAISAFVLTGLLTKGAIATGVLVGWHVVGMLVFLGAGISMNFSVPSALRIYYTRPDTSLVFQFPMLLAPNFTVPLFIAAHLFALLKLLV